VRVKERINNKYYVNPSNPTANSKTTMKTKTERGRGEKGGEPI